MIPASTRRFRYFTYIEPILKTPLVRTYGSVIFTIVTLIVFILFAIKPTVQTIVILQKTIDNQQEILTKLTKKSEDLSLARNNYQNIDPNIKSKIQTAVPNSLQLGSLVKSLEGVTLNTQASISAIQLQPVSIETTINPIPSLKEVEFTYNITGNFTDVKNIFDRLNNLPRLVIIDTVTLSKIEDRNTLIMTVSGKSFYLR